MENDDFLTVSIILFQLRNEEILETKTVFLYRFMLYAMYLGPSEDTHMTLMMSDIQCI